MNNYTGTLSSRYILNTLIGTSILIASTALLFSGIRDHVDLVFADDTGYLGLSYEFPGKIKEGYGPLYVLLFKLFNMIWADPIDVHYNVLVFCSFLSSAGLFLMLRLCRVNLGISLVLAFFLLVSSLNMAFDWWSRISHYTIFFLFLWVGWASWLRRPLFVFLSGTLLAFVLAYIRPETMMTFYVLVILSVAWYVIKDRYRFNMLQLIMGAGIVLFMFATLWKVGNPMAGGSRLGIALGQHYTFNYIKWNDLPPTEWLYWQELTVETFGESESISEFLDNGKEELKRHIASNFTFYFQQAWKELGDIFLPGKVFPFETWVKWLLILTALLAHIAYVGLQDYLQQLLAGIRKIWPILLVLLVFFGPTLASSFLIYPREHYLVLQLPLIFTVVYLLISPQRPGDAYARDWKSPVLFILLSAAILFLTPSIDRYPTKYVWGPYEGIKNIHGIHALRDLNIEDEPVNLLESVGGFPAYLSRNYSWVVPFNKKTPFTEFIDSNHVNMIYVNEILLIDRRYNEDSEFISFLDNYEEMGWKRFPVPGNEAFGHYILVRKDLL